MQTITTEQELDELLKPIKNHLDDNASLDGNMFETFGSELAYVMSQPNNKIWTYCEEDNFLFFQSGYQIVNRLGYLITAEPYLGEETSIRVHDFGIGFPVMWEGEGDNEGLIYGVEQRAYENYLPNGQPDLESHCEIMNIEWFATLEERDEELNG